MVQCHRHTSFDELHWQGVATIMQQLRPQLTFEQLASQLALQFDCGYQLVVATLNENVVGLAGYVIGHKLAWGKHLYIDDLIVDEQHRGQQIGKALFTFCRQLALENNCQSLHLDSGTQRHGAHAFYLHEGMHISSFHFVTAL